MSVDTAPREFHISRQARERYQFDPSLYSVSGNVIFPNFGAVRLFAHKMNQPRDLVRFPEQTVRASEINAMALIDEILHHVVYLYREQKNPVVLEQALAWLDERLGQPAVDRALHAFASEFPALAVYRSEISLDAYLDSRTADVPNRQIVLEEMVMLWLANMNPALGPYLELFDDTSLEHNTAYLQVMASLHDYFDTKPRFGPDSQNLIDMLRAPALASPQSLAGQLEFILRRWGGFLGRFAALLLRSLDFIEEERRMRFLGAGPAQVPVYDYRGESEPERYSRDLDWMPNIVLVAKNTHVWMFQLSQKYGRPITHLDQIPDEELDQLARWGLTGLWLIGIWERSPASQRIKQMMGNPEAVASAYSIFQYRIAEDLGGEPAMQNLRERAWRRGIRLASDMVPNHMAIDSPWVIEHPDWFVSLDHSPFPSYSFNGPDLSRDARIGIFLEDHYYNRTDAAVVFKRLDRWTGDEKYVYHGNDGTSFPWNDTAQLNYLNPNVREAVIQTILHVARQFPVIRFDAAMTLAKKHYQRLWFPEPGTGGAIPSRAEHGMTRAEFDALMPEEFWREVVDRVAAEAPNTLLLAEAFWLMEGYFVRTLGMHRVYNSAFMNMLRDEDNAKYRSVMKNTIEFDPEILKRYVNFMNNPDERTAIDQFGKGDKYFGVCTMMVTLPGLPMFGHGQIDGYAEKYGMEYKRAYWDEQPDIELVRRHEREIFPLLRQRYLFAGVENFRLYDLFTPEGHVDENVFVYSNRVVLQRALIAYHNKFATARGWIRTSAAFSAKTGDGDPSSDSGQARRLVQRNIGEGLALHPEEHYFVIFRDMLTGLEYIRNSKEMWDKGLYVELNAYQRNVFVDFREVPDDEPHWYAQLTSDLNGRGVPSVDQAVRELALRPIHVPFRELVNPGWFRWLLDTRVVSEDQPLDSASLDQCEERMLHLLRAIKQVTGSADDDRDIAAATRHELEAILRLPALAARFAAPRSPQFEAAIAWLQVDEGDTAFWGTLFGWLAVHRLGPVSNAVDLPRQSRACIDEWMLGNIIADTLIEMGATLDAAWHAVSVIKLLTSHQSWSEARDDTPSTILERWLKDDEVLAFLRVNRFEGVVWFNKEAFEEFLRWMFAVAVIEITADPRRSASEAVKRMTDCHDTMVSLLQAEAESEYRLDQLVAATLRLESPRPSPRAASPAGSKQKAVGRNRKAEGSKRKAVGGKRKAEGRKQ